MSYDLNNFLDICVGEKLRDSFVGSEWEAIKKTDDTVTIKNIKGGEKGVRIDLKKDSFFFTLDTIL